MNEQEQPLDLIISDAQKQRIVDFQFQNATIRALLEDFQSRRNPETRRAYREALELFKKFMNAQDDQALIVELFGRGQGNANHQLLRYRQFLEAQNYAPATVNIRLAAVNYLAKLAYKIGLVAWKAEIEGLRVETYKDTRGPVKDQVLKLFDIARQDKNEKRGARDFALLALLFYRALRRNEVITLDVEHVDTDKKILQVLRKQKLERVALTYSDEINAALLAWYKFRGVAPGPLLYSMRIGHTKERLTGGGVWYAIQDLGRRAGFKVWPHALRHSAITEALDLTEGDLRAVREFSGHANINTLMIYDDHRRDRGGEVAQKLSASFEKPEADK